MHYLSPSDKEIKINRHKNYFIPPPAAGVEENKKLKIGEHDLPLTMDIKL
jgi:hypothetical protein